MSYSPRMGSDLFIGRVIHDDALVADAATLDASGYFTAYGPWPEIASSAFGLAPEVARATGSLAFLTAALREQAASLGAEAWADARLRERSIMVDRASFDALASDPASADRDTLALLRPKVMGLALLADVAPSRFRPSLLRRIELELATVHADARIPGARDAAALVPFSLRVLQDAGGEDARFLRWFGDAWDAPDFGTAQSAVDGMIWRASQLASTAVKARDPLFWQRHRDTWWAAPLEKAIGSAFASGAYRVARLEVHCHPAWIDAPLGGRRFVSRAY